MPIRIGARSNGRVSRRRNQVRIIVIAVGEMGTLFQEKIPPILCFELGTISIQVIPAKLVKHQYDNQLRFVMVGIGANSRSTRHNRKKNKQTSNYSHI